MPNRRQLERLKTRDILGVEILASGSWDPAVGGHWDVDDATMKEIASNFTALREVVSPPIKLGHDEHQLLLQTDGYPSAGWVDNVRLKAGKLFADFKKMPAKIADIVEAGGYRKVSVEVWKSMTVDGTKYSNVLTAVSLLGNELPAVTGLNDIVALYASRGTLELDKDSVARVAVVDAPKRKHPRRAALGTGGELSWDDKRELIDIALRDKYGDGLYGYDWPWIEEPFDDAVIVTRDGRHWKVPYVINADGTVTLGTEVEVDQQWVPLTTSGIATDPSAGDAGITAKTKEEAGMDPKRIAGALGLAENATEDQIIEAIGKVKASQPSDITKLTAEVTTLRTETAELRTASAKRDAKDAVDEAIRARKLAPAQREWAEPYAERDPKGFADFVAKTPELFAASAGSEGDKTTDGDDPVETFKAKVAEKQKADPKLTLGAAQSQVSREEPELFALAMGR